MTERFIPQHGGYEDLPSFQKARVIYDATVWFCGRYLQRRDRTNDQMIQAARSGKQNILEGSLASGTSKKTEIKLTNVAEQVWKNCSKIIVTSCAYAACGFGKRTVVKPYL
ncbi:MAG TPA: hypothetical protein VF397_12155 [Pyrinomonadaceae bacterium]